MVGKRPCLRKKKSANTAFKQRKSSRRAAQRERRACAAAVRIHCLAVQHGSPPLPSKRLRSLDASRSWVRHTEEVDCKSKRSVRLYVAVLELFTSRLLLLLLTNTALT
jgi:hypothetical protein